MKENKYMRYLILMSGLLIIITGCGGGGGSGGGGSVSSTSTGTVASGTVTLEWEAPTKNEDDSDLVDLAGYNVYYYPQGSPGSAQSVQIENEFTSASVSGLTPGTWCFITKAYDYSGNESSEASNEVCADIAI